MEDTLQAGTKLADERRRRRVHVVAVPQRGLHGHVNPMLSFCRTLISNSHHSSAPDVHVTLVVTQHWLRSTHHEAGGSDDRLGFLEADETKTEEEALERLLDTALIEPPPDLMVADGFLAWAVAVGERRNIPVASFWPASASLFTTAYHHHLLLSAHSFPLDHQSGNEGEERTDLIPGIPSIRLSDLPGEIQTNNKGVLNTITTAVTTATKAQCIIFRTMNELEEAALTALKTAISVPLFPIGPAIPYPSFTPNRKTIAPDYIKWLDTQQPNSVLYVSLGTYLSAADAQIDELAAGLNDSGIPFLWVAPNRADHHLGAILGDHTLGKVVNWCDQMKVLSHCSIGGFLTHCGWNSTLEAAFSGVPALTFPLGLDQTLNSKLMVEDWGIGWRAKTNFQDLVTRGRISELLSKFMDSEGADRKELDRRCKKLKKLLLLGVAEDGSTTTLDHLFFHVMSQINKW
uniref:Glycosyltransferase n=1 Tax=Rheum officinale TaxID=137220 RepID=A0A7L9A2P6_RHEOF|nr:UDP-glycosyltransferase 87A2-like protein [Rheum officinale]